MRKSWRSRLALLACLAIAGGMCLAPALGAQSTMRTPAQAVPPPSGQSLLAAAAKAETEFRFDVATDRLYTLLIEHPGTPDALIARLRLARLLALAGDLQPAILECQLLRDEVEPGNPLRQQAVAMATVLGRRLRAAASPGAAYFSTFEPWPARGTQNIDEPRTIVFEGEGRFVLLDEGAGRIYRVGQETGAQEAAPQEPTAATVLPDGGVLVFGKTGLATVPASKSVQLTGLQGGSARPFRKVRSMAALSTGDLLVIDRDYDGLIRCQYPAGTCAPAGSVGKQRVVKVGASDWSYLLDDRGQALRILDASQRQIAAFGPMIGNVKLERVEDIAVDQAHGLYLLDRDLKRVSVINLRATPDGKIGAVVAGAFLVPQEGERGLKNPWAMGAAPDGSLVLAGKGAPRIMRLR